MSDWRTDKPKHRLLHVWPDRDQSTASLTLRVRVGVFQDVCGQIVDT